jgi:hypothetical protein
LCASTDLFKGCLSRHFLSSLTRQGQGLVTRSLNSYLSLSATVCSIYYPLGVLPQRGPAPHQPFVSRRKRALLSFIFSSAMIVAPLCPPSGNGTQVGGTNATWDQILPLLLNASFCGSDPSTYLRPDNAGNLIPYLYAALLFFIHLPSTLIRVVRMQKFQWFLIAWTWIEIASYGVAYWSTKMKPSAVLVWSPLLLQQSAGVALHVFILMAEKYGWSLLDLDFIVDPFGSRAKGTVCTLSRTAHTHFSLDVERRPLPGFSRLRSSMEGPARYIRLSSNSTSSVPPMPRSAPVAASFSPSTSPTPLPMPKPLDLPLFASFAKPMPFPMSKPSDLPFFVPSLPTPNPNPRPISFASKLTILPLITFAVILTLEVLGAIMAISHFNEPGLTASWCSPILQPFAKAVIDADCNDYPVTIRSFTGVGCIELPASMQQGWLRVTAILTPCLILTQLVDFCTLLYVTSRYKRANPPSRNWQRPWLTMLLGQFLIAFVPIYGCIHAYNLPGPITEMVNVVTQNPDLSVCIAEFSAAGLRGSIISWTDGVFEGLGSLYYGPVDL